MSRYLVSGVDVWLNTPRRPMEASGTSGQKAAANGVINFSVLDGWWAEAYNQKNGWSIGTNAEYKNYEDQDDSDAVSLYDMLENKIIPTYYNVNEKGYSEEWLKIMKNTIATNAGNYSTARMLKDYVQKIYLPLIENNKKYYNDLQKVSEFEEWKNRIKENFDLIKIKQCNNNYNDITIDAGNNITVGCEVKLPAGVIDKESIEVQVFYGKITEKGIVDDIQITPMEVEDEDKEKITYKAKIALKAGGDYGYTFRVIPKNKMILNSMNLDMIKWVTD